MIPFAAIDIDATGYGTVARKSPFRVTSVTAISLYACVHFFQRISFSPGMRAASLSVRFYVRETLYVVQKILQSARQISKRTPAQCKQEGIALVH